jgi:quercetin dioxygenase-like cupin family protein
MTKGRFARLAAVSYTVKNLRNTKDSAPEFGLSEVQEAHFVGGELGAESTGMSFHVIHPGQRQFGHRHDNAEEIYVVVAGSGTVKLDDESVELSRLDAVRVAPKVSRGFAAGPDGLELLAFGPRHDGDGELLGEGFWD